MGSDQQFCLRWHNYQSSLLASLPQFLDGDDLTDVTLSAGGRSLKAHRVVLSACSLYFKDLFKAIEPFQHPVLVLPGANFTDLCALVTFMYSGEVNIYQDQLQGLLAMADAMQIRGLANVTTPTRHFPSETATTIKREEVAVSTPKRPKLSTQGSRGPAVPPPPTEVESQLLRATLGDMDLYRAALAGAENGGTESSVSASPPPASVERDSSPPSDTRGGGASPQPGPDDPVATTKHSPFALKPFVPKPYATCLVCGKQLSNQYNLRVHMETHQNVNYACTVCSHVSRSRDALRKHVSYRHPGEGPLRRPRGTDPSPQHPSLP